MKRLTFLALAVMFFGAAAANAASKRDTATALKTVCLTYHSIGTAEEREKEPEAYRYLTIIVRVFWNSGKGRAFSPFPTIPRRPNAATLLFLPHGFRGKNNSAHGVKATLLSGFHYTAEEFERQVRYLADEGYEFLKASELGFGGAKKSVCIMFDDGYSNNEQATAILQKYGAAATISVITDLIGKKGHATAEALIIMQESGVWEIASHSSSHRDMTALLTKDGKPDLEAITNELKNSKAALEEITGAAVTTFTYPYGKTSAEIIKAAAKYYDQAFALSAPEEDPADGAKLFAIPRIIVGSGMTITQFKQMIKNAR